MAKQQASQELQQLKEAKQQREAAEAQQLHGAPESQPDAPFELQACPIYMTILSILAFSLSDMYMYISCTTRPL